MFVKAGAAPGPPPQVRRTGPTGIGERRKATGWITREPGRPGPVRGGHRWKGNSQREQSRPWPGAGPHLHRERASDGTKHAGAHGTGRRNNEPKGSGAGSRSVLIVPSRSGNRVHRDPAEGSGASHGRNRRRETREDTELCQRVNETRADSRTGGSLPGLGVHLGQASCGTRADAPSDQDPTGRHEPSSRLHFPGFTHLRGQSRWARAFRSVWNRARQSRTFGSAGDGALPTPPNRPPMVSRYDGFGGQPLSGRICGLRDILRSRRVVMGWQARLLWAAQ